MRTKPTKDYYKGPQARRSIHSTMESPKMSNFRKQKPTIGWRIESDEEYNTSDEDVELRNEAHFKEEDVPVDRNSGYNKMQIRPRFHHLDRKLRYIPESADHPSDIPIYGNKETLYETEAKTKRYQQNHSQKKNVVSSKIEKHQEGKLGRPNWMYIIIGLLILIIIIFINISVSNNSKEVASSLGNEKYLRDEIKNIRNEFPSQNLDIWYTFSSGIKDIESDPSHPSVFLILYDRGEATPFCLAVKIAKAAMNFLNVTKSDPIILDGIELGQNTALINDYGELIAEEKLKVEEHRTMIVKNLHKVPGKIAQSFHSLCDKYSPLVDKAVYLFTLQAVGANDNKYPTALAEKKLEQMWKKELHEDKLAPLITRITDNVVVVKSEAHLASSCSNMI